MNRTALVTTTIRVPKVLAAMCVMPQNMHVIVVGDLSSPHNEIRELLDSLSCDATYMHPDEQGVYELSGTLGWNSIQRRNIGYLEAYRLGYDSVLTIDDDNLPLDDYFVQEHINALTTPHTGLMKTSVLGRDWYDVCSHLHPYPGYHRGYLYGGIEREVRSFGRTVPVHGQVIGVNAGLWLGTPDVDATTRLTTDPQVTSLDDVARHGFTLDHDVWSPFNSQNTAFVRELLPALFLVPFMGRYDDIWASYVTRACIHAINADLYVRYGTPAVYQQRNPHNFVDDLLQEIDGIRVSRLFIRELMNVVDALNGELHNAPASAYVTRFWEYCKDQEFTWIPRKTITSALAWCRDIAKIEGTMQ